ncbi:MAG: CCDC90 family protein [Magnetococcus sp. YQC-3]
MTAVTFDTLKYANRLKSAGVPDKQAVAMAEAHAEVSENSLDGFVTDAKLERACRPIRTELAVIEWMLGVQMAGVMALILKSFFPH